MNELEHPSPALDRRMVLIGGALLAAGGAAVARQPQPVVPPVRKGELEKLVPLAIGDWRFQDASGVVLPPADAFQDTLYRGGVVVRSYAAPHRAPIMLLVAYSNVQDGMLQVHRPEFCYTAGGYKLSPTRHLVLNDGMGGEIPADAFSADGISRTEQVVYWTRIGNLFPVSWPLQRLAVARANIEGFIPDGLLLRLSTLAPDMESALPDLKAFAAALIRAAPPAGRRLMANVA